MDWLRKTYQRFLVFLAQKKIRPIMVGITGLIIGLMFVETGLNLWIRSALRANLTDPKAQTRLEARLSWLTIPDLISGRIDRVTLNGKSCLIGDLRLERLAVASQGFRFDLPLLLRTKQLRFREIHTTQVKATLSEKALRDYINLKYPGYNLDLNLLSNQIRLMGVAEIFGSQVPVVLEGGMGTSGVHNLRFYPVRLLLSGRPVGRSLLKFIGDQIPLEFPLLENWPLQLTGFVIKPGVLELSWRDWELKKGDSENPSNNIGKQKG